jgi:hypothetical protein
MFEGLFIVCSEQKMIRFRSEVARGENLATGYGRLSRESATLFLTTSEEC